MIEKFFAELPSLLKTFIVKNWRKPIALILICLIIVYSYFFEVPKYIKGFEANEASLPFLVLILFLTFGVWFYMRFKYKLAVRQTTFGIIINHEDRNTEEINRILKPIISEIQSQIKEIKIIELESHLFVTEQQAASFLENNDYGLKQILHIKADIGKVNGNEEFIVDSAVFRTHGMPTKFMVFGVQVDINQEVSLRNPSQWSFSMSNEVVGTKSTRLEIRDVVYYYLGLSSVCIGKPELGLSILKRLVVPLDLVRESISTQEESIDEQERIRRNKKFFLASRLVHILSSLCRQVFLDYHNSGKDPLETKGFLEEYAALLKGSREAIVTYIPLARYSFDLGDVDAAKEYTKKAATLNPSSIGVLLNQGFFSILDDDATGLLRHYKALIGQIQAHVKSGHPGPYYNALEIISFYNDQYAKYPDKHLLFNYAVAFHTILSIDTKEGTKLINKFQGAIAANPKYKVLDVQCRYLINNAHALMSVTKSAGTRTGIAKSNITPRKAA